MRVFAWAGAAIAALAATPFLIMYIAGIGVFNANVQAKLAKHNLGANVTRQVFNPQNKIQSQGYFEALNADLDGFLAKIKVQKALVASSPSDFNKTNLAAIEQQCIDTAQTYNAAARSISSQAFLSADLPYQLDSGACSQ